ncbi:hypothetical protein K491DRAFT_718345 [Lophiostoma macrostomum CBS 122681]|uniref:Uncharacterized protein n=1 Tax=Lophiostoma macrostomum CBS 122681 TaxID=1314788 RepID=A0A6A6T2J5_9PLEO|nr:hypothetical protein K491DRAFT_718345 [Lophiostoma macrostomum CBS 122681]
MAHSRDNSRFNRRLPDEVKDRIFAYAGREAYSAFQIARNAREKQHALYEPFTYWDWHGADEQADWQNEDKRKKRLLWERERGFRADGGMWSGYPFAQKRWRAFQYQINDSNRWYVKRIATARWMSTADLLWIARELPALEALELSDWLDEHIGDPSTPISDWTEVLDRLLGVQPRTLELSDLEYFTYYGLGETKESIAARLSAAINQANEDESDGFPEAYLVLQTLGLDLVEQQETFNTIQKQKDSRYVVSDELQQIIYEAGTRNILARLKWLGVSSWTQHDGQHPISIIVPQCERLQTLSIRGPPGYGQLGVQGNSAGMWEDVGAHGQVCELILGLVQNVPESVATIELRRAVDFLPHLLEKLSEMKPTIKSVAIDLGAWIQMYPLRRLEVKPSNLPGSVLGDYEIEITARSAAHYTNDIAEQIGHLPTINRSKTEPSRSTNDAVDELDAIEVKRDKDEEFEDFKYKKKQRRYYAEDGGSWISAGSGEVEDEDEAGLADGDAHGFCPLDGTSETGHAATRTRLKDLKINALPRLLTMLYEAAHDSEISLIPLDPDPEDRSTNPIHPLALIQAGDECGRGCGSRYRNVRPGDDFTEIYRWLNEAFKWRPVFDWDWFMVPEKMLDTVDSAYQMMFSNETDCLGRIEDQFRSLKDAGISLHLLIGRRDESSSSCYWGWPYEEHKWKAWLDRPFDSNLDSIAGLVDGLSIFYDLRNPLHAKRLEDIDTLEPVKRPAATCPAVPCPWAKVGEHYPIYEDCPFITQRKPLGYPEIDNSKRGSQKMANKQTLKPKCLTPVEYARLANSSTAAPPVGQNANDHPSDDSDIDDGSNSISDVPLHHLARRAAFTREAVGWQRFWSTYALKFTNLTLLRVRMPRCFDTVGSWRLAKLLDQNVGWQMLIHTDERQRIQSSEDLIRHIASREPYTFEHKLESKIWPAGRFVRRSWIWPKTKTDFLPIGEETERTWVMTSEPTTSRGNRAFTKEDAQYTQEWEEQEYAKASERAAAAAHKEREAEVSLEQMLEEDPLPLENRRRRKKLYHHALRHFGQRIWEQELQTHIDRLTDDNNDWPDIDEDDEGAQMEQSRLDNMIDWLKTRQKEDVPIFGEPQHDDLNDTGDIKAEMGWRDLGPLAGADWVQEQVTMYEATAAHHDVDFRDAGGLPVLISTDPEKRLSDASAVSRKSISKGGDLESPSSSAKPPRLEAVSEEPLEETIHVTTTGSTAGKRKRAGSAQSSQGKAAKQARFEDISPTQPVPPTPTTPRSSEPATALMKNKPFESSTEKRPPTPMPSNTSSKGRSRAKTASDLPSVPEEAPAVPSIPAGPGPAEPPIPPTPSTAPSRKRKASSTTMASDPSTSRLPTPPPKKTKLSSNQATHPASEPDTKPDPKPTSTKAASTGSRKRKRKPTPTPTSTAPSATEPRPISRASAPPTTSSEPPSKKAKGATAKPAPTPLPRDPMPSIDSPSPLPDPIQDPSPDELAASPSDQDPAASTAKSSSKRTMAQPRKRSSVQAYVPPRGALDDDDEVDEEELAPSRSTSSRARAGARGSGRGSGRGSSRVARGAASTSAPTSTPAREELAPEPEAEPDLPKPSETTATTSSRGRGRGGLRGSRAVRAARGGSSRGGKKGSTEAEAEPTPAPAAEPGTKTESRAKDKGKTKAEKEKEKEKEKEVGKSKSKTKSKSAANAGVALELKSPVAGRTRSKRRAAGGG